MKPTNPQALDRTIAWLEAGAPCTKIEGDEIIVGFGMCAWIEEAHCGCVCCIGGAIRQFELKNKHAAIYSYDSGRENGSVVETVGMTDNDADRLFEPVGKSFLLGGKRYNPWASTPQQAARVVRHYRDTGEVNWRLMADENTQELSSSSGPVLHDASQQVGEGEGSSEDRS